MELTALEYERQLESEGLGVLDGSDLAARQGFRHAAKGDEPSSTERAVSLGASLDAVRRWQAWARAVAEDFEFSGARQRAVWHLYANGSPLTEIQQAMGGSRRSITKALDRVKRGSPSAPVPNPWRRSGRDAPGKPQLRPVPLEAEDMAKQALNYKRIMLRKGWEVYLPDRPHVALERIVNVEGTPHAGGIDVVALGGVVVTVPWWKIQQADQAGPE